MSSIKDYLNTSTPSSTGVHSNIDNLILEAELNKFDKTGVMYADKRGQYVGGVDPVVENVAMSPILTLKSLGDVGRKILSKTGLRNPVSHHTFGSNALNILKSRNIKGTSSQFPGKPFKESFADKKIRELYGKGLPLEKSPAVSVTRDPMFTSRPHSNIGTDIKFVLDRDAMVKKGFSIKPYAETNYRKTLTESLDLDHYKEVFGKYAKQMNPRFEFEERVRGNIPIDNVKLIDILKFPKWKMEKELPSVLRRKSNILHEILSQDIPMVMSSKAKEQILDMLNNKELLTNREIKKIINTPTYNFDPFKRRTPPFY